MSVEIRPFAIRNGFVPPAFDMSVRDTYTNQFGVLNSMNHPSLSLELARARFGSFEIWTNIDFANLGGNIVAIAVARYGVRMSVLYFE